MSQVLLDADTLINLLRQRQPVISHAQQQLNMFGDLITSAISFYEVVRGLHVGQASAQKRRLRFLDPQLTILSVERVVAERAANLHVYLRDRNAYLPDADILIAATALVHNLTLATSSQRHYSRIPGLALVDWRQTTST